MSTDTLESFTASQLTRARAMDFVRFLALQTHYSGDPSAVSLAIRNFSQFYPRSMHLHLFEKAAVSAGTTLDATFAAPVPLRPLADGFLELLRPAPLIGRIPGLREVPFQVNVLAQTAGGSYGWLGEGAAAPATKSDFATVSLGRAKVGGLVVLSKELTELSSPSAVAVMQRELIEGCKTVPRSAVHRSGGGGRGERVAGQHHEWCGDECQRRDIASECGDGLAIAHDELLCGQSVCRKRRGADDPGERRRLVARAQSADADDQGRDGPWHSGHHQRYRRCPARSCWMPVKF